MANTEPRSSTDYMDNQQYDESEEDSTTCMTSKFYVYSGAASFLKTLLALKVLF